MVERKPRMTNVAYVVPAAMESLQAFSKSGDGTGVPPKIVPLIQVRASQINGCAVCLDMHTRFMLHEGESVDRLMAVSAWRDSTLFTDAERAALDLAESVTRLADRPDPVPDSVWDEAARHFNEKQLAGLLIGITAINAWNRLNVSTHQHPIAWSPKEGWKAEAAAQSGAEASAKA
jgi:AhpD family alkylhydroperoxidase